jgi:hypothetical protein
VSRGVFRHRPRSRLGLLRERRFAFTSSGIATASVTDTAEISDVLDLEIWTPVSDGVDVSDSPDPDVTDVESLTDGADLSDDAVAIIAVPASASDAVDLSDTPAPIVEEVESLVDGVDVSEDFTTVTYELWGGDGLDVSDSPDPVVTDVESLTDGAELSETVVGVEPLHTADSVDGIDLSDSPDPAVTDVETLTDGVEMSETVVGVEAVTTADAVDGLEVSEDFETKTFEIWGGDGVELSDTPVGVTEVFDVDAVDGFELSENFDLVVDEIFDDEGIVLSELVDPEADVPVALTDGADLSDDAVPGVPEPAVDGIELSDALGLAITFDVTIVDGVEVGDSLGAFWFDIDSISDGVVLSETVEDVSGLDALPAHLKPWPANWPLYSRPDRNRYTLKSGETFEWGVFVVKDSDEIKEVTGLDPTPIFGLALEDAEDVLHEGEILVCKADNKVKYAMQGFRVPQAGDKGKEYGIVKDSDGIWIVDTRDEVNTRLEVTNVHLNRDLYICRVMAAHRQG